MNVFVRAFTKSYIPGLTFANPAADWRIVVRICAACVSTPNRICLTLNNVINFNEITYL